MCIIISHFQVVACYMYEAFKRCIVKYYLK